MFFFFLSDLRSISCLKRLRNWLIFMSVVFIWGSNWSVMKTALSFVGPLNIVFQRLLFSSIVLFPFLFLSSFRIPKDKNTLRRLFILSIINICIAISTHTGLVHEKSGIGAVLTYTQPLFVFCLAVPFLKEKPSSGRILGILFGFSGVIILFLRKELSFSNFTYQSFLMIIGAFLWAVSIIYYKKFLSHVNPIVTNFFQQSIGAAFVSVLSFRTEGFTFPLNINYLFLVLYMSLASSTLAMTLWVFLLREEEATVLSTASFIVPAIALILGNLILNESLGIVSILGIALILSGIYLVNKT